MLANPSFEEKDPANDGLADAWTLTVVATFIFAGFALDSGLERAWEAFDDGWSGFSFVTEVDTPAEFNVGVELPAPTYESFSLGWFSGGYFFDLGAMVTTSFAFETFSSGWGSDVHHTTLAISTTFAGTETFASGWFSGAYATTLAVSTTTAMFTGAATAYETFSPVLAPIPFTADPATDTFSAVSHGLADGKRVLVESDGQLPSGLNHRAAYFVVGATTHTFQLSPVSGGAAVDIGNQGAGAHRVISDGLLEWGELLT